jgi:GNAT superfamily N-acetyltransferase
MKLTFRLDPWLPDAYYEPSGVLVALLNSVEVGRLTFYYERQVELFHLEGLTVNPELRGKGIGIALHKKLHSIVRRRWPWHRYATGEVTSVGALRLLKRVFGDPLYIADNVKRYTYEEALTLLPAYGCTDANGVIDCTRGTLYVNVWYGRGAPPKNHPWKEWD